SQCTSGNRMKQRMEDLKKEVNEYRYQAQEQQNTIQDNQDGIRSRTESGIGNNRPDKRARSSVSVSTSLSSRRSGPVNSNCNNARSQGESSSLGSSRALDVDMGGGPRLLGNAVSHETEPSTAMLSPIEAITQPQGPEQPTHSLPGIPPQLSFASSPKFASPPPT